MFSRHTHPLLPLRMRKPMAVLLWNARKVAHGKITATEEEIEAAWKRREERNKIWKGKSENEKA